MFAREIVVIILAVAAGALAWFLHFLGAPLKVILALAAVIAVLVIARRYGRYYDPSGTGPEVGAGDWSPDTHHGSGHSGHGGGDSGGGDSGGGDGGGGDGGGGGD